MKPTKKRTPWNKGKKGVMPAPWNKGKKTPKKTREKQRIAKLKNPVKYWEGKKRLSMTDEKHFKWKDDEVSYRCLHLWVERKLGKARMCEECGLNKIGRFHWHNTDGKYSRDLTKYKQLCPACHSKIHSRLRVPKL